MKLDQIGPLHNSEQNRPGITEDIRLKMVIIGKKRSANHSSTSNIATDTTNSNTLTIDNTHQYYFLDSRSNTIKTD